MGLTLEVPNEDAAELAYETPSDTAWDDLKVVSNEQVDTGRWTSHHVLVVQRVSDGLFFETTYQKGLTEMQYCRPFEDDGDTITFYQVFPVEVVKTTIEYKRVPE